MTCNKYVNICDLSNHLKQNISENILNTLKKKYNMKDLCFAWGNAETWYVFCVGKSNGVGGTTDKNIALSFICLIGGFTN